ncbi:Hypothetical protein, putative [Bodo saltans]|uniref:Uncharacterized protein n=1 Tax=Bodo saltans TaxID=75058 RepID=A0A0S4IV13_BODSA|nr:Hypothetical protein, putative [Bodo saltans]|eukprot:CUF47480.1 Hypothetical protein, putative [Bodo saltans]
MDTAFVQCQRKETNGNQEMTLLFSFLFLKKKDNDDIFLYLFRHAMFFFATL